MTRFMTLVLALALAGPAHADATMRAVSGQLSIAEAVVLPPDAHVSVVIRAADGAAIGRGESRTEGRQAPLPFRVWVPATASGTVTAAISVDGRTGWRSPEIAVQPGTGEADLGTVAMEQVADLGLPEEAPFAPATEAPAEPDPAEAEPVEIAPEVAEPEVVEPEPAEPAPAEADPVEPALVADEPLRFLCGEDAVRVAVENGAATVSVGPIDVDLQAVADGRFEAEGDPDTFLDLGERTARIALAGIELPECEPLGPAQ